MYKIIGADQKEYGPVPAEQLRQWVAEGRVSGQTSIQAEGMTEWKPLAEFFEFADLFGPRPVAADATAGYAGQPGSPEDLLARDYDLDIGGCVGAAWNLLKNNFGMICGGVAVFVLVQIGISLLGRIPILGVMISFASFFITGPLTGGLYYFLLRNIRQQPAEIGDIFAGFRLAFVQLLLGYIVTALLAGLSALPGVAIMAFPIYTMVHNHAAEAGYILIAVFGLMVTIIPVTYFSVGWMFSLPLIIDRQMDFWPAMGLSRKMVGKHWWQVFGLLVVCGLINMGGLLACCVGIFVSFPIVLGAMMYAYETIFSKPTTQTP